eukprot:1891893-Pyramimonas_sp.AAC.1
MDGTPAAVPLPSPTATERSEDSPGLQLALPSCPQEPPRASAEDVANRLKSKLGAARERAADEAPDEDEALDEDEAPDEGEAPRKRPAAALRRPAAASSP